MSGDYTAFFYGTLMAPEVLYSVCYGNSMPPQAIKDLHTISPAILHNYCRHRVEGAPYPGIVDEEGQSVRGTYVTGLTSANMVKLDYFEGSQYERREVKVKLLTRDGEKEVEDEEKDAITYVFLHRDDLKDEEWDYEDFRKNHLRYWSRGDWKDDQDPADRALGGEI